MPVLCFGPVCVPLNLLLPFLLGILHHYGWLKWIKQEWVTFRYWRMQYKGWRASAGAPATAAALASMTGVPAARTPARQHTIQWHDANEGHQQRKSLDAQWHDADEGEQHRRSLDPQWHDADTEEQQQEHKQEHKQEQQQAKQQQQPKKQQQKHLAPWRNAYDEHKQSKLIAAHQPLAVFAGKKAPAKPENEFLCSGDVCRLRTVPSKSIPGVTEANWAALRRRITA